MIPHDKKELGGRSKGRYLKDYNNWQTLSTVTQLVSSANLSSLSTLLTVNSANSVNSLSTCQLCQLVNSANSANSVVSLGYSQWQTCQLISLSIQYELCQLHQFHQSLRT